MIKYLKSGKLKPVPALTTPPRKDDPTLGYVVPNFQEGSMLLCGPGGKKIRLVWQKTKEKVPDQRRAVPPGKYLVLHYTLSRQDDKGNKWFLSGTGHRIRQFVVHKRHKTMVSMSDSIQLKPHVKLKDDGMLHVGVAVWGEHHCGLTIYKDGKRIPIRFRVTDRNNRQIASGALKYG